MRPPFVSTVIWFKCYPCNGSEGLIDTNEIGCNAGYKRCSGGGSVQRHSLGFQSFQEESCCTPAYTVGAI